MAVFCASLAACQQESGLNPATPTGLTINQPSLALFVTDSVIVSAEVVSGHTVFDSVTVQWSTDNSAVLRVRPRGTQADVEALALGTADLIAEYAGFADTILVTVVGPGAITVTPRSVQLALSADSVTGHDQIVEVRADVSATSGAPIDAPVRWHFTANEVAGLDTASGQEVRVRALGVGTTTLIATAYSIADTVTISVVPDTRYLTKLINIVPDSTRTDVHAPADRFPLVEFRAFNGFGDNVCRDVHLDLRADSSVAVAVQQAVPPDATNCKMLITPLGPGQTWVRAAVNDVRDSVLVTVTDIEYATNFDVVPDSLTIAPGDTVQYSVHVRDDGERPVAGLTVNFNLNSDASSQPQVGALSATSVVTDATGHASVRWFLPQTAQFFAAGNDRLQLEYAVELPNLQVAHGTARPALLPGPVAALRFQASPLITDTITALVDSLGFLNRGYLIQAFDRFGNFVNTAVSFSVSDPDIGEVQVLEALAGVTVPASAQVVDVQGVRAGVTSLTVRQGAISRTAPVSVIAGPTIVTAELASTVVRVSQISTTFNRVDVYTGGLTNDFPTFTQSRDTVALLLFQAANQWVANAVAADGSTKAAPVPLYPAVYGASYAWGFPVFKPEPGKLGDVVFISDSAALGKSNVYIANRVTNAVTRVTNNLNPRIRYRGLSLAPDGNRVLVVVDSFTHPTRPDSSIASNLFEVNLTTGTLTQLTQNSLLSAEVYHYAAYSPDGTVIYVDHSGPVVSRELLALHGGIFDKLVVEAGPVGPFEPTFNPASASLIAYLDANQVRFQSVGGTLSQPGLSGIKSFSWSRR